MSEQTAAGPGGTPPRPRTVRRDAVRNHQRVLDAAHEVLAETGPGATMEQIAARAGVGVGTVYRRFPSKDHLLDELLRLSREQMLETADQALRESDDRGLDHLLHALGPRLAAQSRYAGLLMTRDPDPAASSRLRGIVAELVRRAIRSGAIDPGITADDVMALIRGMRVAAAVGPDGGETAPDAWQRFLRIHLAGMRAGVSPRGMRLSRLWGRAEIVSLDPPLLAGFSSETIRVRPHRIISWNIGEFVPSPGRLPHLQGYASRNVPG